MSKLPQHVQLHVTKPLPIWTRWYYRLRKQPFPEVLLWEADVEWSDLIYGEPANGYVTVNSEFKVVGARTIYVLPFAYPRWLRWLSRGRL